VFAGSADPLMSYWVFGEFGVRLHLEPTRVLESPYATHITHRIVK
jgi:hypothetical protein